MLAGLAKSLDSHAANVSWIDIGLLKAPAVDWALGVREVRAGKRRVGKDIERVERKI